MFIQHRQVEKTYIVSNCAYVCAVLVLWIAAQYSRFTGYKERKVWPPRPLAIETGQGQLLTATRIL